MCLTVSIIGKCERGSSNPSTAHLIKLAEVLKASFDWLATGKKQEKNLDITTNDAMQNIHINQIVKQLPTTKKTKL